MVVDCSDLDRSAAFWCEVLGYRRVEAAGAVRVSGQCEEDGWRWHVLADPDGNEFCVLQPGS